LRTIYIYLFFWEGGGRIPLDDISKCVIQEEGKCAKVGVRLVMVKTASFYHVFMEGFEDAV